jgi:hypothetical protein
MTRPRRPEAHLGNNVVHQDCCAPLPTFVVETFHVGTCWVHQTPNHDDHAAQTFSHLPQRLETEDVPVIQASNGTVDAQRLQHVLLCCHPRCDRGVPCLDGCLAVSYPGSPLQSVECRRTIVSAARCERC